MKQLEMLYEGKAKQVFRTDDPDKIIIHYKDAATAFNNVKKATIENKGVLNNAISTLIFKELQKAGVKTHYIETLNERDQLCRRVEIIPLEVIVRNTIAGAMAQRLGIEEGTQPGNVIYDICYKKDELGDPLINDHHAVALGAATYGELDEIYKMTAKINEVLKGLFAKMNIKLVDFKIEFGRGVARHLPPVGRHDQRKTRQGPFPPRSGQGPRGIRGDSGTSEENHGIR